jgi:hypothetical protein
MPGLLDIAPPEIKTKRFEIRGGSLEVRALRHRELVMLTVRYPDMQRPGASVAEISIAGIDARVAAIAAALDKIGDEATETAIKERLTDSEAQEIFDEIIAMSNVPSPLAGGPALFAAGPVPNGATATISPPPSSS